MNIFGWNSIPLANFTKTINPYLDRAVVVERSNALVYLITSSLELKVEGSKHGLSETSFCFVKPYLESRFKFFVSCNLDFQDDDMQSRHMKS